MKRALLFFALFTFASQAMAWWNEEWAARRPITLDTSKTGVDTGEAQSNVPVLVRLHTGNFDFLSAGIDGADLRFVAGDDKTPLKFHLEKFDSANQLALIWVQAPKLEPGSNTQKIWLYYGNENAPAEANAAGTYDASHVGVYHFSESGTAPQDATGNANHAADFAGPRVAGLIAGGRGFDGSAALSIPASQSMHFTPAGGLTVSAWVKTAGQGGELFRLQDGGNAVVVALEGGKLIAQINGVRTAPADLPAATWTHVALALGPQARLYVNGAPAAEAAAAVPEMNSTVTVGQGFKGEIDELELANVARSGDYIKAAALGQGAEARLGSVGEEEGTESEGEASYFGVILQNVTLDGWVVIVVLMVMLAIAFLVMVSKALLISKTGKANRDFMDAFRKLGRGETARLDAEDDPDEADLKDSALLTAMFGKHDHFQNSSLYRIYHAGVQELKHRFGDRATGELSPQALDVIKASLDGTLVRENQKLNNLMVLLTIAISGGPFLGLLGTVVGVMITFAAIAATGDVNVAAIAPGIAAALVATVAGLAVAIPALFGYNYLGSRIKSISADMHVFVDEFLAKIAESYSR
jgi:biopolymer transport protein ExbB